MPVASSHWVALFILLAIVMLYNAYLFIGVKTVTGSNKTTMVLTTFPPENRQQGKVNHKTTVLVYNVNYTLNEARMGIVTIADIKAQKLYEWQIETMVFKFIHHQYLSHQCCTFITYTMLYNMNRDVTLELIITTIS